LHVAWRRGSEEIAMVENLCNHGACQCRDEDLDSDGYCSDACREGRESRGQCGCGHPDCA
jgi:hypothetical protein